MNPSIYSEYGKLKKVLVHRPGKEIEKLTPDNLRALLFEDIPFLEAMQKEHDNFVRILEENEIEVFYVERLLSEILNNEEIKKQLIRTVTFSERCESITDDLISRYSSEELLHILIEGMTAQEAQEKHLRFIEGSNIQNDYFIIQPLPNLYFTRDPAFIVGNGFVSSNMHHIARIRESILLEYIFRYHPNFKNKIQYLFGIEDDERRPYTIEGGDVLVLNSEAVAIGCSERTRSESIRKFAKKLFERKMFKRVYEVYIPFKREYMHLDTVLTIIDKDTVVAFPDALDIAPETRLYTEASIFGQIEADLSIERISFLACLEHELGKFQIIKTGGSKNKYASKEQRSDATNTLAIAPKKIIVYDRNINTNISLKEYDIEVIEIPGSELVRGLGGPRCMTMPLEREG